MSPWRFEGPPRSSRGGLTQVNAIFDRPPKESVQFPSGWPGSLDTLTGSKVKVAKFPRALSSRTRLWLGAAVLAGG
jgi:hypothetical protein